MQRGRGRVESDMHRESVIEYCAARPGAMETYPFTEGAMVFKVAGRMFAIVALEGEPGSVSLKCPPELAVALRSTYPAVSAGYHLNKRHWNTVDLDGSVPSDVLAEMIGQSYDLVVASLSKKTRDSLAP
jgi:predicted DNA-binding protein (MmcQ/YjbR family)